MTHHEGFVHAHLNLTHMEHITQPNHLEHAITVAIVSIATFSAFVVPEASNTSTPVVNVEDDQIFVIFDVDDFSIYFHGEEAWQV